ncbi:MAG TPA: biosynthetic peptidoglycan transglycosylase [Polyangia bacterium]
MGAALVLLVAYPYLGGAIAAHRATSLLRERLGVDVDIGEARAGLTGVVFRSIRVGQGGPTSAPLARVATARIPFSAALFRRGTIVVDGATFDVRRGGDDDNVSAMMATLRSKRASSAAAPASSTEPRLPAVTLTNAKVRLHDAASALTVDIEKLGCQLIPGTSVSMRAEKIGGVLALGNAGGPLFGAGVLTVDEALTGLRPRGYPAVTIDGGFATPLPKLSLTGIHGKILPTARAAPAEGKPAEELTVDLDGSYGGARETLWTARGGLDPATRAGQLSLRAERFSLGEIADVLPKTILSPADTNVDAAFDVSWADGAVRFGGNMRVSGLSFQHHALASDPIRNVDIGLVLRGTAFPAARRVAIDRLEGSIGELHGKLSGFVELGPGTVTFADGSKLGFRPRLELALEIPKLPCAKALASLPAAVVPRLQGFVLQGMFGADVSTRIDYADLDALELKGKIGIDGCRVLKVPPDVKALTSNESIAQSVEVPVAPDSHADGSTELMDFIVGPENPDFVPYEEISPFLVASILTTEDNGFFKHRGWVSSEFRTALKHNLERGGFRGGASSITMQMVKNVLLSQEKTLSRKLQELFLVWYLEQEVPKERILELYFNAIEFGPRIYGIGRATQHYFGKKPSELTPLEAAFFSSILPSPKRRYIQYCHGAPLPAWDRYLHRILAKVHERGRISDEDFAAAQGQKLVFDRSESEMNERQCLDWVKKMTARPEPEVPAEGDALDGDADAEGDGPLPVGKLRRLFSQAKEGKRARAGKAARRP